jgi:hypothetical protein
MQESYGEGLASRTGPKPCADARKGMGEASAGVRAGRVLSRERGNQIGAPTPSERPEGNTPRAAKARLAAGSARSKTSRTPGNSPRRNWETPGPAVAVTSQGPRREPKGHDGDVRDRGVGQTHSTEEAPEQRWCCGAVGGGGRGKGPGQGESFPANPAYRTQSRSWLAKRVGKDTAGCLRV